MTTFAARNTEGWRKVVAAANMAMTAIGLTADGTKMIDATRSLAIGTITIATVRGIIIEMTDTATEKGTPETIAIEIEIEIAETPAITETVTGSVTVSMIGTEIVSASVSASGIGIGTGTAIAIDTTKHGLRTTAEWLLYVASMSFVALAMTRIRETRTTML